ncbi:MULTISPECIES: glycerol-3-phosphate responsive antiterminator [unclassified Paenibacillus]|uniref:glycerol-3-phosphate responsive antiterminator n=1 Tax=unclassified Paenibacillus TaxID=185978 RepID=UPI0002DE2053|nr:MULTISPECIES: glycerol-3-phosphate responsive antiterminator [unclassified Paenibacillus]MCM3339649.1 glycerol-3-phosphate responsive antiterminator [Paenibacillus sp. MER TA 81-3]
MYFANQQILPAVRQMKDFEKLLTSPFEYLVLLDVHIAQLKPIFQMSHPYQKKLLLHVDLIQGLQSDSYAAEFLCQEFNPYGLLSTKANVIIRAKQKGVIAIQRIFLIDNSSFEKSCSLLEKTNPDFIEVLPSPMLHVMNKSKQGPDIPLLAGGFIRTTADVDEALGAGAVAVTTSSKELWKHYADHGADRVKKRN